MKQIQYTTAKKHCLFVMLPEQWKVHSVTKEAFEGNNILCLKHPIIRGFKMINIPNGYDWQLQGFVSELTDEQKEGVVDKYSAPLSLYKNYIIDSGYMEHLCTTASESFASLLTSLNVLLVNPLQDEPPHNYGLLHMYPTGDKLMDLSFKDAIDWQTAQLQVGKWILLTCNK